MKINCIKKTIDLNKIHWAIDCFKATHNGDSPSYIVINHETRAVLMDNYYDVMRLDSGKGIRKAEQLFGISIALNEGLKFGEVDIV